MPGPARAPIGVGPLQTTAATDLRPELRRDDYGCRRDVMKSPKAWQSLVA